MQGNPINTHVEDTKQCFFKLPLVGTCKPSLRIDL